MRLTDSIQYLKGVGPETGIKLQRLGIRTIFDLINHWPRQYEDYSKIQSIRNITPGPVTLEVQFRSVKSRYVRRGMHITEATAFDATGAVKIVWFNQPYRADSLRNSHSYFLSGELSFNNTQLSIVNPAIELATDMPANTARILPKYRETKGITSNQLRKLFTSARSLMHDLPENLPSWMIAENDLIPHAEAIETLHFPLSIEDLSAAKRRLAFEEALGLTLATQITRKEIEHEKGIALEYDELLIKNFVANLPFTLTKDQKIVSWKILGDLQAARPMNRLVEGDVGSGKTVVATIAALHTLNAGHQVLLLAPTELLARQHYKSVTNLLKGFIDPDQIALLVGGLKKPEKETVKRSAAANTQRLIIGTHALLEESLEMSSLGLIIIDEQHRFGVRQRQKLVAKAGHMPHVLSLTATPIPRSLALTLYGELDVSIIAEKPADRLPILTSIHSPDSRMQLYRDIDAVIEKGQQLYVVCPLIKESDVVKHVSAHEMYDLLTKQYLQHRKIGLLHGKLKAADKDAVMQSFASGKLDVLVSTTVIEVGVDVPNATAIVIEGADAFGLAQLHQLRGRVGRGAVQSHCYLVPSTSQNPSKRLRALASSSDGFKLAELDLELRGPGQIYGTFQHGQLDLRLIRLSDTKLIAAAREAAKVFIQKGESLVDYPELDARITKLKQITHLN